MNGNKSNNSKMQVEERSWKWSRVQGYMRVMSVKRSTRVCQADVTSKTNKTHDGAQTKGGGHATNDRHVKTHRPLPPPLFGQHPLSQQVPPEGHTCVLLGHCLVPCAGLLSTASNTNASATSIANDALVVLLTLGSITGAGKPKKRRDQGEARGVRAKEAEWKGRQDKDGKGGERREQQPRRAPAAK